MTLISIFVVQLVFCFGLCFYTNLKVSKAEQRNVAQKAEFYSFLYQFHKQMSDEEQAMQALYGKSGGPMGGTPGGKGILE
jgi:hypothetical protein